MDNATQNNSFGRFYAGEEIPYCNLDIYPKEDMNCGIIAVSCLKGVDYFDVKEIFKKHQSGGVNNYAIYADEFDLKYLVLENDFDKIPNESIVSLVTATPECEIIFLRDDLTGVDAPTAHVFVKRNSARLQF